MVKYILNNASRGPKVSVIRCSPFVGEHHPLKFQNRFLRNYVLWRWNKIILRSRNVKITRTTILSRREMEIWRRSWCAGQFVPGSLYFWSEIADRTYLAAAIDAIPIDSSQAVTNWRRFSRSGQAIKLFQAPRNISFTFHFWHKSFILDDMKLAVILQQLERMWHFRRL